MCLNYILFVNSWKKEISNTIIIDNYRYVISTQACTLFEFKINNEIIFLSIIFLELTSEKINTTRYA